MIGLYIAATALFWLVFMFLNPAWLGLAGALPLAVYVIVVYFPQYWWALVMLALLLLVLDIQILRYDLTFFRTWRYWVWLPSLLLFVWYSFYFPQMHLKGGWLSQAWGYLFGSFLLIVLGKLWIGDALLLLINRVKIIDQQMVTYHVAKLYVKRSGRSLSYYLLSSNQHQLELSGMVYWYLKWKGVGKGSNVILQFKAGWLNVEYATGFPQVEKLKG